MTDDLSAEASLEYVVVDVFTSRAYAGNPLAVVFGADGLTDDELLSLTVEFNLSETAFPIAMTAADVEAGADYRVRIFTPDREIPFAGHPTVGTAWVLRDRLLLEPGRRVQACGAGLVGVRVPDDPTSAIELTATPGDAARRLTDSEVQAVCSLVGLSTEDVAGPAHIAGCGLSWVYLRVQPSAVARARAGVQRVDEAGLNLTGLTDVPDGVDVYAVGAADSDGAESDVEARSTLRVNSRVFVPGTGISEDPATGSAAAGLGLALVDAGEAAADGTTVYEITQGVDMGRPSLLLGRVEATDGVATLTHVAGQVVPVAAGRIRVP